MIGNSADTSRVPKPHELEGREYYFRTKKEMLERIQAGDMIEWGELDGQLYGTRFPYSSHVLFHTINILLFHYEV